MITILDIARARGAKEDARGAINAEQIEALGLPFMGGCQVCGATLGCYNACPGRNGFLIGKCCADAEDTYATVDEYDSAQLARAATSPLPAPQCECFNTHCPCNGYCDGTADRKVTPLEDGVLGVPLELCHYCVDEAMETGYFSPATHVVDNL
jgi:hypothetical protein